MEECNGGYQPTKEKEKLPLNQMPLTDVNEAREYLRLCAPFVVDKYVIDRANNRMSMLMQISKMLLTYIDENEKYVKRLERMNDKLLGNEI